MESNENKISTIASDKPMTAKHKQMVMMVVMAVVAVLGIGFGVTGIVIGNQKTHMVQDLEAQLAENSKDIADTTTDVISDGTSTSVIVEENQQEKPQENLEINAQLAQDYIYVGAWGKKFKIPSGLTTVSFLYDGAHDYLCVSGVKYIEGGMHYFPEFAELQWDANDHRCLGIVSREHLETGVEYRYSHPQALYGDEGELSWETESTELVRELLTKNMEDF